MIAQAYPAGADWLDRRLDDVESEVARCLVVASGIFVVGAAIETPKERQRLKLSTLWMASPWRGLGHGGALLDRLRRRWLADELERVNLTAEATIASSMGKFLSRAGFRTACIDRDRYGEGRHEVVFEWRPETDPAIGPRPAAQASEPLVAAS